MKKATATMMKVIERLEDYQRKLEASFSTAEDSFQWHRLSMAFALEDFRQRLLALSPVPMPLVTRLEALKVRCARGDSDESYFTESAVLRKDIESFFASPSALLSRTGTKGVN